MAKRYMPVTETITTPRSPASATAMDTQADPDTPPPTQRPGRSRGHGKWRAPQSATPGVGTRSKTRQAELETAEATLAQASCAVWPEKPDRTQQIQHMTRDLHISDRPQDTFSDRPQDTFKEIQRTLPIHHIDENTRTKSDLQRPVYARINRMFSSFHPRALVVALWGSQPP